MNQILLEGYTAEEIMSFSNEQLDVFVFCNEPLLFKIGTATLLGKFNVADNTLLIELGHIEGGGEGVLPSLASLAMRYAKRECLTYIEWRVHAIHCANPNLKLRSVLEKRGFVIREIPDVGECYWQRVLV